MQTLTNGLDEDGIDVEKKETIEWFHKTGKGSPDREVYALCRKCQHGVTFTGLVSDQEAVRKKGSKSLHTWLLVSREHKSVRTKCVRWETRTDSEPDTLGSSMNTSTLGSSTNSEQTSAVPPGTPTGTPTGGSTGGSMGSMTSSKLRSIAPEEAIPHSLVQEELVEVSEKDQQDLLAKWIEERMKENWAHPMENAVPTTSWY